MTGPLKLLKSQNLITVMLNITPLTLNLYSLGNSMFVTLTVISDKSFPKSPLRSPTNFLSCNGTTTKSCNCFPSEMITYQTCPVNIIPLTVKLSHP